MKRSELIISKKIYEYLGGFGHLRGMNHWNITTPDDKKYHIRSLVDMHGSIAGTDIFQGHYGDGNEDVEHIASVKNYNDGIRFILGIKEGSLKDNAS